MINNPKHIVIVTDLDACLLDESYSFEAANEALAMISQMRIPLVFNSSKTLDELLVIAERLKEAPMLIAENGTTLAVPVDSPIADAIDSKEIISGYKCIYSKGTQRRISEIINMIRVEYNFKFKAFSDMTASEISGLTGLDLDSSQRAKNRFSTEPILWEGTEDDWYTFKGLLAGLSIQAVRGGQFIHLMDIGYDKGLGMLNILSLLKESDPSIEWVSVALGDSPNDISMLLKADFPIVIPNRKHGTLSIDVPDCYVSDLYSSQGWNEAIMNFLNTNLKII